MKQYQINIVRCIKELIFILYHIFSIVVDVDMFNVNLVVLYEFRLEGGHTTNSNQNVGRKHSELVTEVIVASWYRSISL